MNTFVLLLASASSLNEAQNTLLHSKLVQKAPLFPRVWLPSWRYLPECRRFRRQARGFSSGGYSVLPMLHPQDNLLSRHQPGGKSLGGLFSSLAPFFIGQSFDSHVRTLLSSYENAQPACKAALNFRRARCRRILTVSNDSPSSRAISDAVRSCIS